MQRVINLQYQRKADQVACFWYRSNWKKILSNCWEFEVRQKGSGEAAQGKGQNSRSIKKRIWKNEKWLYRPTKREGNKDLALAGAYQRECWDER